MSSALLIATLNPKNQIQLICEFLKAWRSSRQISQEQVKHATRIDVSNYETGRCAIGMLNLLILCDFYGIAVGWLLKSTEDVDSGLLPKDEFLNRAKKS